MSMDFGKLKESAAKHFRERMRDKVEYTTERCWNVNLEGSVEEIGKIIEAAKQFEVTDAMPLSEDEVKQIVANLIPLHTLKMVAEAREYLIGALVQKGVDPNIFHPNV